MTVKHYKFAVYNPQSKNKKPKYNIIMNHSHKPTLQLTPSTKIIDIFLELCSSPSCFVTGVSPVASAILNIPHMHKPVSLTLVLSALTTQIKQWNFRFKHISLIFDFVFQLNALLVYYIFSIFLYMFRAILCSSSGGSIVYTQHLVLYVSLWKQLSDSVKV